MRTFRDSLNKRMKDEDLRRVNEAIQLEKDICRAIVEARKSRNFTQQELATRTGIHQTVISKLEKGTRPPTLNMLKQLAAGLDMSLKIEFVPREQE